jgi:hypothetical protein
MGMIPQTAVGSVKSLYLNLNDQGVSSPQLILHLGPEVARWSANGKGMQRRVSYLCTYLAALPTTNSGKRVTFETHFSTTNSNLAIAHPRVPSCFHYFGTEHSSVSHLGFPASSSQPPKGMSSQPLPWSNAERVVDDAARAVLSNISFDASGWSV